MDTPASGAQPASSPGPSRTCPHCGAVLPADAPEGQCPACLLLNLTLEPTVASSSPTQPAAPPQPPAPPLSPEELAPCFPQLEILECLGRGGMGVVYKARQKTLNRLVALKLLAPEREKDAAFAERFTREAQALAVLSHPHIVTVYDFGITSQAGGTGDGFYYLLMEYVDGVNLRHLLDQRKLTAEEALAIVPPLCDALQFAHERGIVHRDIKPENLLLDKRGQVKIADFGIAKMLGNGTPSHTMGGTPVESAPAPLGVTQPESALGTPAYMVPEQASAPERVDSRADIYSLGVVFYEMLTGELPARQLETTTSRLKNLHIDVRVDEIVLRALEKKPEMRWQTAADLRTRIEEVSSASAASPPVLPGTPGHDAAAEAPASPPRPFRPWMQRFVARSFTSRQRLFWCLMVSGALLTVCFMMPVSKYRAHPALIVPVEQPYLLTSKDEWIIRGEFGLPDAWWSETVRQATVPTVNADGKFAGRTAARGPQIERSVDLFTWSYAMGLVAAIIWIVLWCCVAAEQRAGKRLPPERRAFAAPLVDRSQGVRVRWGRIVVLLLAFCGMSIALSGHMTAIMMLMLGDAPSPAFNALWTAFFLSFALVKGLGQELVGAPSTAAGYGDLPVMPHARACGPTAAAAGFVTAYVVPLFLALLATMMAGHVQDRSLIVVFLVTWGVSSVVAHYVLSRRKLPEDVQRRWLRITSICGWFVSVPAIGLGIFFIFAAADEGFRWNPAPAEAFIVPIMWLGAVLLPVASGHLWHVSGIDSEVPLRAGRIALGILLLVAAVALPVAGSLLHFLAHTRAQVVYQQKRAVQERRVAIERHNLAEIQADHRSAQEDHDRAPAAQEKSQLSRRVEDLGRSVARQEQLVAQANRELAQLISPSISPVHPRFTALIAVSVLCLVMAVAMLRRPASTTTPLSGVLPIAATLLVLGAVAMMLSQISPPRSRLVQPVVEVELPFAYNHTVRGNVLLVTLTALVKGDDIEGRVLLHGTPLSSDASGLAARSHSEPAARPGLQNHEQPRKLLYVGNNQWQIAFAFPDAAMAQEAGRNLRPMGMLAPKQGRAVAATLFQVQSQVHGMYQGEILFSVIGDPVVSGSMGATISTTDASYDGVLFRGTSVEHLPGTRYIQFHFTRSDNSGLGLETAQDINLSPDGKGPVAVGTPGWKLSHWVGPEGPHTLTWTLPAEFSDEDMQDAVRELEREWLKPRMLPNGGVPLFARIKHHDGWTCTLMARVLRSPGQGKKPVPGMPGTGVMDSPRSTTSPIEPPSASSLPDPMRLPIVPASGAETDIERLRTSLVLWRAERENLAKTYKPSHPKMKQLDDRIEATENVIQALTAYEKSQTPATSSTVPGLAPGAENTTDPPMQDTSDTALQALPWQTFDQTPGQYWRQLTEVRRFREAAELIERYLALHPELDEGSQQINGANLHFHAAQCHAFAGNKEKALGHFHKALLPLPLPDQESLQWHYYVMATKFFLVGERDGLISTYEAMAKRTVFNYPNIIVLDRLLAGFGKPYAEAYDSNESDDHKKLSADCFNRAWELLDRKTRSPEDDAQMLSYAHASLAHWRQRDDCNARNLSIGYWQISRVYAVLREGHAAQVFAQLCLAVSAQEPPFYLGYAHEACARAALLVKDSHSFQKHLQEARAQVVLVTEKRDREALEKDLNLLEADQNEDPPKASSLGIPVPGTPPPLMPTSPRPASSSDTPVPGMPPPQSVPPGTKASSGSTLAE